MHCAAKRRCLPGVGHHVREGAAGAGGRGAGVESAGGSAGWSPCRSDPANVRNSAARTRRTCKNSDAPPFRLLRRKQKKQQLIRRPRGARLRPGPKAPPPPPPPWASNPSPATDPFAPAPRRPSPHRHSDGQGWQGRGVARVAGRQNVATPAGSRVAKKIYEITL